MAHILYFILSLPINLSQWWPQRCSSWPFLLPFENDLFLMNRSSKQTKFLNWVFQLWVERSIGKRGSWPEPEERSDKVERRSVIVRATPGWKVRCIINGTDSLTASTCRVYNQCSAGTAVHVHGSNCLAHGAETLTNVPIYHANEILAKHSGLLFLVFRQASTRVCSSRPTTVDWSDTNGSTTPHYQSQPTITAWCRILG